MTSLSVLKKCLQGAIKNGDTESLADVFLKNQDVLNHHDNNTDVVEFLLLEAANCEDEGIIKLLFKFVETSSRSCKNFDKRLGVAMAEGNLRLAEYSLRNGAKLEGAEALPEMYLRSVFEKTDVKVRKEMLTLFIQYGRLNTDLTNDEGKNLLHVLGTLIKEDDVDVPGIAEILLNCGVPLDEPDNNGFTPLNYSILSKNTQLVSLLAKKGADVNRKISSGSFVGVFPLLMAAKDDNSELVEALITLGADVNAENSFGWTVLHQACAYHWARVIHLLVQKGAEVSPVDLYGRTPTSVILPCVGYTSESPVLGLIILMKEFARLCYEKIEILREDFELILRHPVAREHYEKCLLELDLMSSTEFHPLYSFYSLLKMSKRNKKLAQLAKNPEVVEKFEAGLGRFSYYEYDLKKIFNEALLVRDKRMVIESSLKSEFGDKFVII